MSTSSFIVRLWLPDRPGTLGRVAAAIGRADADVIGIEILERGAGTAIDEVTVQFGDDTTIERIVSELASVEGVAVEDAHEVEPGRPDPGVLALEVVSGVVSAGPRRLEVLCRGVRDLLEADWVAVIDVEAGEIASHDGSVPDPAWLTAFVAGTVHLPATSELTPSDVAWAPVTGTGSVLAAERSGRAFRARERQQIERIGRVVGALQSPS
ncbi:MAG: ACT domain-containing protein [Actinomycetota bacterium]|nr:ACT domain-containing protein [Actinomycetota bacterium]MDA2971476.1 ACT domain-containing protein [Actinomycetota bacterium]MDA3000741.1 ACT domain-containing protein [Actinomycetota bacterium]